MLVESLYHCVDMSWRIDEQYLPHSAVNTKIRMDLRIHTTWESEPYNPMHWREHQLHWELTELKTESIRPIFLKIRDNPYNPHLNHKDFYGSVIIGCKSDRLFGWFFNFHSRPNVCIQHESQRSFRSHDNSWLHWFHQFIFFVPIGWIDVIFATSIRPTSRWLFSFNFVIKS